MILVLFLIVSIITLVALIITSTLHIQIKNLSISNTKIKNKAEYQVRFALYLFNKIKWLWFNLNDKKAKKMYTKMQLEKKDYKKTIKKIKDLKQLTKLYPKISYLNANVNIGVIDPVVTSLLVSIIAILISVILPYLAKNIKQNTYTYKINPLYYNNNLYKINVNCIIEIKMVHIINVIYVLYRKGRKKNEQSTTSNRKSYAYSHE